MLNRSAVVVGHAPAFTGWLKTTGVPPERLVELEETHDRIVYLIPACHHPQELDEVVEDLFEEIFVRELRVWQPAPAHWPDTADFALFGRWFTVLPAAGVDDVGRGPIGEELG